MFKDKIVVITGGSSGIGLAIKKSFERENATVLSIDKKENSYFTADVSNKKSLEEFAKKVIDDYGKIDYLINNAPPLFKGIDSCSYEEFEYSLRIGVVSAFYLTKLFLPHFSKDASIVNISSSRDRMSEPFTESYSAAKGALFSLTHSLAVSLRDKVRVNSISPGWIDTDYKIYEGADALQHPAGRVGNPDDIANMVLYLCSKKASFITGENITIDGGMTRQMIYHGDDNWTLNL